MKHLTVYCLIIATAASVRAATTQKHYYAHDAVEDENGVIAPWYTGSNGQMDWRVRIAAETMKRYPWTPEGKAPRRLPEYMWSGAWKIDKEGKITIPPIDDWANGDLGQRAAYVLAGWVDYYRYSGDAAAIAHMSLMADMLLDFALTPEDHPWPKFLISVPTKGKPYGQADPHGFIQLDNSAETGIPLIKAAQIVGGPQGERWMAAARHWGDLLAEHCATRRHIPPSQGGKEGGLKDESATSRGTSVGNQTPLNPPLVRGDFAERRGDLPPWGRYANPRDVPWEDNMTGNVVFLLEFFDTLIAAGYTGKDNAIVEARKAGIAWLQTMLDKWLVHDTWGRNFWDWNAPVQLENVTEFVARYVMEHQEEFPNWRNDARNILTLFLNRTATSPSSKTDVYSGAWAHPESSGCCGRSLWYGPMEIAPMYAELGTVAKDPLMAEIGRRQMILATYDAHENGIVEDNIDGGQIVAGAWFKIAHPMALKHCLNMIAWQPEVFAPPGENHIVRSTATVTKVIYGQGSLYFATAAAPKRSVAEIRCCFRPTRIVLDKESGSLVLGKVHVLDHVGFMCRDLGHGDWLVSIRHDGFTNCTIEGDTHETFVKADGMELTGNWEHAGPIVGAKEAEAVATLSFKGSWVRVIGPSIPLGGIAEVELDGKKERAAIDAWCPRGQDEVLYSRNGLTDDKHVLRIRVTGKGNPASGGSYIGLGSVQYGSSTKPGISARAELSAQRWIFGYPERTDYVDKDGNAWRPATEWVVRAGNLVDSVAAAWWTARRCFEVEGTSDPELYRYGAHGKEFWADFTVTTNPGGHRPSDPPESPLGKGGPPYHVRLKFAETRNVEPKLRAMDIFINGKEVVHRFDIAGTAVGGESQRAGTAKKAHAAWSGTGRAVDLVFNGVEPKNGVISIRFAGSQGGEAIVQAIEVGPGDGGEGATPVSVPATQPASRGG